MCYTRDINQQQGSRNQRLPSCILLCLQKGAEFARIEVFHKRAESTKKDSVFVFYENLTEKATASIVANSVKRKGFKKGMWTSLF